MFSKLQSTENRRRVSLFVLPPFFGFKLILNYFYYKSNKCLLEYVHASRIRKRPLSQIKGRSMFVKDQVAEQKVTTVVFNASTTRVVG